MNLREYLESKGATIRGGPTRGWVRLKCPFHDDHRPSASVNFTENRFNCFTCGLNEDLIGLLRHIEGVTYTQAKQTAEENSGESDGHIRTGRRDRGKISAGSRNSDGDSDPEPLWRRLFT